MIIVAGGDSFVYGSELADCQGVYSRNTFTSLLAQGHDYQCVAWPGNSNDGIARRVVAECEATLPDLPVVIVSWTFPGRYEFRFNYDTNQRGSPWYNINAWTIKDDPTTIEKEFVNQNNSILHHQIKNIVKAKENGISDFARSFYKNIGDSEYWEIYTTLKEIVYLQNYLKTNRIPYLFTCADNSFWYNHTIQTADATIHSLTEQVHRDQANWFWFPAGVGKNQTEQPRGFYQWAVENKYPIGTTHPLEEAHQAAAQLMKDQFDAMVKKHI
jgi:hypothetical protein